jgi:polygalacturonase
MNIAKLFFHDRPRAGCILSAALASVLFLNSGCRGAWTNSAAENDAWSRVPGILKRIVPPVFQPRDWQITQFGAKGDGITDCSSAFKNAIDACHKAGGGRVVVLEGNYLTGPIRLQSGVNLHLMKGANIRFSTDTKRYLPVVFSRFESTEVMNYSPFIYALDQENIAITGEGTFDGQASKGEWLKWIGIWKDSIATLVDMGNRNVPVSERVFGEGWYLRPNFVQLIRCRNLLIDGVRFTDSPMWVLNPVLCTNVTVRGVVVDSKGRGMKSPNSDGCDPDSSSDVLIEGCTFNCDDDCIAIKSGRDVDGRRVNVPSQNIIIRNCKFIAGHGGVTAGSETAGGIRNVFAEKCELDSPDLRMAIRLKTNARRGGFIENFYVRDCTVKTASTGIHMTMKYEGVASGPEVPLIRNVQIRNVSFGSLKQAVFIEGLSPSVRITDVTISRCRFPQAPQSNVITNATRVSINEQD